MEVTDDLIMHKKLKAPIYMTKKHLSKDMASIFGSLGKFLYISIFEFFTRTAFLVGINDQHIPSARIEHRLQERL